MFTKQVSGQWQCPCGCGQSFLRETGLIHYADEGEAVYRLHFLKEDEEGPQLWLLLGTGSWLPSEPRGSWIAVHSWLKDGEVIARIEDPDVTPFDDTDVFGERLLMRDEVFGQPGGAEWVFRCHDLIIDRHQRTREFFGAHPAS